jgi:hypothetical protein
LYIRAPKVLGDHGSKIGKTLQTRATTKRIPATSYLRTCIPARPWRASILDPIERQVPTFPSGPHPPIRPDATNERTPGSRNPMTCTHERAWGTPIFEPTERGPSVNIGATRNQERWLLAAIQTLLRCQRSFFNQLDGQSSDEKENPDSELVQALRKTRTGTEEEKREIRRWALNQHITEVLHEVRGPRDRRQILHSQMMTLLSIEDDDGGDNMWVLEGFDQFMAAIEQQDAEIAKLEKAESHRQLERVAAAAWREQHAKDQRDNRGRWAQRWRAPPEKRW